MANMKRWRVRAMTRTYGEAGPDLLQTKVLAQNDLARTMGKTSNGWYVRVNPEGGGTWTKQAMTKAEVLQRYEGWQRGAGDEKRFQIGRKVQGKIDPRFESMTIVVPHVHLPNTNAGTMLVADLARAQFDCQTLGFSCREYNNIPGSGWSDHAWGDAVDLIGHNNDALTDWCVRMARAGCMQQPAQFIGSRDGKVGTFYAPNYVWSLGGPPSHLTHVHCSYKQHFGRDPNCS